MPSPTAMSVESPSPLSSENTTAGEGKMSEEEEEGEKVKLEEGGGKRGRRIGTSLAPRGWSVTSLDQRLGTRLDWNRRGREKVCERERRSRQKYITQCGSSPDGEDPVDP